MYVPREVLWTSGCCNLTLQQVCQINTSGCPRLTRPFDLCWSCHSALHLKTSLHTMWPHKCKQWQSVTCEIREPTRHRGAANEQFERQVLPQTIVSTFLNLSQHHCQTRPTLRQTDNFYDRAVQAQRSWCIWYYTIQYTYLYFLSRLPRLPLKLPLYHLLITRSPTFLVWASARGTHCQRQ